MLLLSKVEKAKATTGGDSQKHGAGLVRMRKEGRQEAEKRGKLTLRAWYFQLLISEGGNCIVET